MVNEISKQNLSLVQNKTATTDVDIKPVSSTKAEPAIAESDSAEQDSQVTRAAVEQTVQRLNDAVQSIERDLQFSVDESSGDTIIKVLDKQTSEVIRQIPTEDVLAIRENIESLKGILFSAEV